MLECNEGCSFEKGGGSRKDGATSGSMKELQGIIKGRRKTLRGGGGGGGGRGRLRNWKEWRNAVKAGGCCLEFIAYPFAIVR